MKQQLGKYITVELDEKALLADQALPVLKNLKDKVESGEIDPIKKAKWDNAGLAAILGKAIAILEAEQAEDQAAQV